MDRPAPGPDGPPPEAPDRATDDPRPSTVATTVGVGAACAGAALSVLGTAPALRILGVAVAAVGVAVLAAHRSRPSGSGDDDPVPLDGVGTAFVWSRFAPAMTLLTFLAATTAAVSLAQATLLVGLPMLAVFFAMIGVLALAVAVRFSPALRRRSVLVTATGVTVELRGARAELPWATITSVDVGRPAPPAEAMGGAITLRILDHELPGPARMQRRLRLLAAPYGPGADIALPVAGLRHDPGALLIALERGRPG